MIDADALIAEIDRQLASGQTVVQLTGTYTIEPLFEAFKEYYESRGCRVSYDDDGSLFIYAATS